MNIYQSDRGDKVVRFMNSLCVPEGMHQGQPFRLRNWQTDIIRRVYNPVDEYGHRVVRKVIYSVAKKNGKTPIVSGVVLAHLCGPEAKTNEQLYSAAFEREQAAITFRYARQMVEMDDELSSVVNVKAATKELVATNGSIFKALSSEVKGKHGIGPALLLFDELAQFGADREFYDTLAQGRGAHLEPLMWIISTQAENDAALLSQEIDYGLKVMRGEIDDPTVVCFLFETPPEMDIEDEEAWKLSNPAYGDFLNPADMREAARTAKAMPSAEAGFRNLRLNQRVSSAAHLITPNVWKANGEEPDLSVFEDQPVTGGLDLSGKNDLTSLEYVAEDHEKNWHVLSFFWTPADNLKERADRDKVPYCLWRDQGYLTAVPGKTIDYRYVARAIAEHRSRMNIVGIKFDRWRIADLQRALDEEGVDAWIEGVDWSPPPKNHTGTWPPMPDGLRLIPHGQGFKDMNPAVEILEDALAEGRVRHGMNPVLTMCAMNVRAQKDPAGNRKFDKIKSTGRIDGLVALAMALNGATGSPPKNAGPSVYEGRGFLTLG